MQRTSAPHTLPSPDGLPTPARRSVLLADCDVYYVQLARLADPEGAGQASLLIVGGTADSRGVVCSASYEVREFGVRSGMPIARAVRLCPQAMCVPIPRRLCMQKSREVVRVLQRFAPAVQSASPDEAYLDLTSTMQTVYRGRTLDSVAHAIRSSVLAETQIRVSFGGGTNRLVAKLAVERAKPRPGSGATGVYIVQPGDEAAFVATFALADIQGIGPKFQERLARIGWHTVRDVLPHDRSALERIAGKRQGQWLYNVVRGIDQAPVQARSPAKSIGHETTFRHDRTDDVELRQTLLALTDHAVSDMRAAGYGARTIAVKVKDADFVLRRASRTTPIALTTYQAIALIVAELLAKLRATRRVPVRLVGVNLSQLAGDDRSDQLPLFDTPPGERETLKQRRLAEAVDHVRERLGHDAISYGHDGR